MNETKMKSSGFEEGKIFNGFRYIFPLQYNNQHVGSVEISMSSVSVIEILSELHQNQDYFFVIDQDVVKDNLFADQLANYRDSNILDNYHVDNEIDEFTAIHNTVTPISQKFFFNSIKEEHSERFEAKESFTTVHTYEGNDYLVTFLRINNFKENPSAYLISVSQCAVGYADFMQDIYWEVMLVTFLALFIMAFGLLLAFYQSNLKDSAELNYLTNIYNRNKFYEITKREVKTAKRYNQEIAVMFINIDHFKRLNDTYGHAWGHKALQELAKQVLLNIREVDVLARWGGEEFVLLLPNTGKEGALVVTEKVRKQIDECRAEELNDLTISIGVSVLNPETCDIDQAIALADLAIYEAKQKGRNQICCK